MVLASIIPDISAVHKFKRADCKPEVLISQFVDEIETQFQRLNLLCFWGLAIEQKYWVLGILFHQTGNGNTKKAAIKLKVTIYQIVDKIGTRFQRLYLCFSGSSNPKERLRIISNKTGNGKTNMAAIKLVVTISQLVDQMSG